MKIKNQESIMMQNREKRQPRWGLVLGVLFTFLWFSPQLWDRTGTTKGRSGLLSSMQVGATLVGDHHGPPPWQLRRVWMFLVCGTSHSPGLSFVSRWPYEVKTQPSYEGVGLRPSLRMLSRIPISISFLIRSSTRSCKPLPDSRESVEKICNIGEDVSNVAVSMQEPSALLAWDACC